MIKARPALYLSCGVLRAELDELQKRGKIEGDLLYLDSMLHMKPVALEKILVTEMEKHSSEIMPIVLVYGDCCSHMLDLVRKYKAGRVNAINCAQMLTGKERYRELMHAEAFILLPEWAVRWKDIMKTELGLSPEIARELMGENRNELVYLDTGLSEVPEKELAECAEFTGLPWRAEKAGLDNLLLLLAEARDALS